MTLSTTTSPEGTIVAIDGRIDTTNYLEFEQVVTDVLDKEVQTLFLDASQLSYISSSGLRVLLSVQKKMMASGGSFRLFALQPGIKEIFDISGFSAIFSIFPTIEAAKVG